MKKRIRILSMLAALALILGVTAGCSGNAGTEAAATTTTVTQASAAASSETSAERAMVGNTYVTGLPIVKDPITLTIAVSTHAMDEYANDFSKKTFVGIAEEATGIKVDWKTPSSEQYSVMLAGNDLPDAFIGSFKDSDVTNSSNVFIPLNDLLETYAPDVFSLYDTSCPGWRDFLTYPDGNIYSLMGGYYQSYLHMADSVTWINSRWLENVGMDLPATTDEFYEVLKAFKEQDANGNGDANDEIPMDFCDSAYGGSTVYMSQSWGIQNTYNISGDTVEASVNTDNYRAYLEYYHKLYAEGLINSEGFSQTNDQYKANGSNDIIGVWLGWAVTDFLTDADKIAEWVPLSVLEVSGMSEDVRTVYNASKNKLRANRNDFMITTSCKEVEAALRWWDYLSSSQDMAMLVAWGAEGVGYDKGDDGVYYCKVIDDATLAKLGLTNNTAYKASIGIINYHPLVLQNLSVDTEKYPALSDSCRRRGINAIYDYMPEEAMSRAVVPADKQEELTLISTDLTALINSYRGTAITESVTDENWETYKQQLSDYGYDKYIQWYQDYLDGNF